MTTTYEPCPHCGGLTACYCGQRIEMIYEALVRKASDSIDMELLQWTLEQTHNAPAN